MKRYAEKLRKNYSASLRTRNFSISSWKNPKTPYCHDFGISGRDPEPQTNIIYLWKHQDTSKESRQIRQRVREICFGNLRNVGNKEIENVGEGGHRNIQTIRLTVSGESWICDKYLSKNMKWQVGKMDHRIFET